MKADCTQSINGRIGGKGKDIQKFLVAILFHFYDWKYNEWPTAQFEKGN